VPATTELRHERILSEVGAICVDMLTGTLLVSRFVANANSVISFMTCEITDV